MINKKAIIALKKARTSIDKNLEMLEKDKYCIDIIQQNLSVIWLLKSANLSILEGHLWSCFKNSIMKWNNQEIDSKIEEILKIVKTAQSK